MKNLQSIFLTLIGLCLFAVSMAAQNKIMVGCLWSHMTENDIGQIHYWMKNDKFN